MAEDEDAGHWVEALISQEATPTPPTVESPPTEEERIDAVLTERCVDAWEKFLVREDIVEFSAGGPEPAEFIRRDFSKRVFKNPGSHVYILQAAKRLGFESMIVRSGYGGVRYRHHPWYRDASEAARIAAMSVPPPPPVSLPRNGNVQKLAPAAPPLPVSPKPVRVIQVLIGVGAYWQQWFMSDNPSEGESHMHWLREEGQHESLVEYLQNHDYVCLSRNPVAQTSTWRKELP
jgi:hypothetical protein